MSKTNIEKLAGLPNWPGLLTAEAAGAFTSLPLAAFHRAVMQGQLPPPVRLAGRLLWSRRKIETYFAPDGEAPVHDPEFDPVMAAIEAAA